MQHHTLKSMVAVDFKKTATCRLKSDSVKIEPGDTIAFVLSTDPSNVLAHVRVDAVQDLNIEETPTGIYTVLGLQKIDQPTANRVIAERCGRRDMQDLYDFLQICYRDPSDPLKTRNEFVFRHTTGVHVFIGSAADQPRRIAPTPTPQQFAGSAVFFETGESRSGWLMRCPD